MIRIKDYIFSESDIRQIYYDSEMNKLIISKYENMYNIEIGQATFDDIEWNYEDSFVQRMEEECRKLKEEIKKFDVIKELLKREERIYGSLSDVENRILKTIDGEK